jgi:hypothetical protein
VREAVNLKFLFAQFWRCGGEYLDFVMEYFKIIGKNKNTFYINLETVVWIEFMDEECEIIFGKDVGKAISSVMDEKKYRETKERLVKVLTASMREFD